MASEKTSSEGIPFADFEARMFFAAACNKCRSLQQDLLKCRAKAMAGENADNCLSEFYKFVGCTSKFVGELRAGTSTGGWMHVPTEEGTVGFFKQPSFGMHLFGFPPMEPESTSPEMPKEVSDLLSIKDFKDAETTGDDPESKGLRCERAHIQFSRCEAQMLQDPMGGMWCQKLKQVFEGCMKKQGLNKPVQSGLQ